MATHKGEDKMPVQVGIIVVVVVAVVCHMILTLHCIVYICYYTIVYYTILYINYKYMHNILHCTTIGWVYRNAAIRGGVP